MKLADKIKAHPAVKELRDEAVTVRDARAVWGDEAKHDWWCDLKEGFQFEGCSSIHEMTLRDVWLNLQHLDT